MTIEEAKKVFFEYNGSLFGMAREEKGARIGETAEYFGIAKLYEEKEIYDKFNKLNISDNLLKKWRQELFSCLYKQFKESGSYELFNKMYDISENKRSKDDLLILKESLYKVKYANAKVNACISETVLGRKNISERSGMIFWAYDIGEKEIANELLDFVYELVKVKTTDEKIELRLKNSIKKYNAISNEICN